MTQVYKNFQSVTMLSIASRKQKPNNVTLNASQMYSKVRPTNFYL